MSDVPVPRETMLAFSEMMNLHERLRSAAMEMMAAQTPQDKATVKKKFEALEAEYEALSAKHQKVFEYGERGSPE